MIWKCLRNVLLLKQNKKNEIFTKRKLYLKKKMHITIEINMTPFDPLKFIIFMKGTFSIEIISIKRIRIEKNTLK